MTGQSDFTITPGDFAAVFPFHFLLDREMCIQQAGPGLLRLCPDIRMGERIDRWIVLERPPVSIDFESLSRHLAQLLIVFFPQAGARLMGQIRGVEGDRFVFLGNPWLTDPDEAARLGLNASDFAVHDPIMDLLLVGQAQRVAVRELEELADRLTERQTQLRSASESAHKALRELAQQKFALDQHAIVVVTDVRGTILYANDRFSEISGYAREEVIGKTHRVVNSGYHPPEFWREMYATIGSGRVWHGEIRNRSKQGRIYWVKTTIVPFLGADGKPERYISIRSDITERKRAEEALNAETELLSLTLETIVDGVISIDAARRVTLMNQVAQELTGWSAAESLGRTIDEVFVIGEGVGGLAPGPIAAVFERAVRVGTVHDTKDLLELRTRTGETRTIVAGGFPMFHESEGLVGCVIVFRDVTQEIEVERLKTDFVSAVSHELRTPLTSVKGFIDSILSDPEMPAEAREEFLHIAKEQTRRLEQLVNQILEVHRSDTGKLDFKDEAVDLVQITRQALAEFTGPARQAGVMLTDRIAGELPAMRGDPGRLRSVITNLLSNAIKFTPRGGEVRLDLSASQDQVTWSVADTGVGIPKDQLHRIFEKFYRVRRPGTQRQGTGLGLSIMKSIVDRMGGQIQVESEPGRGSTFRVLLPRDATVRREVDER